MSSGNSACAASRDPGHFVEIEMHPDVRRPVLPKDTGAIEDQCPGGPQDVAARSSNAVAAQHRSDRSGEHLRAEQRADRTASEREGFEEIEIRIADRPYGRPFGREEGLARGLVRGMHDQGGRELRISLTAGANLAHLFAAEDSPEVAHEEKERRALVELVAERTLAEVATDQLELLCRGGETAECAHCAPPKRARMRSWR